MKDNTIHRALTFPIGAGESFRWIGLCDLSEEQHSYGSGLTWDWKEVTCPKCLKVGELSELIIGEGVSG